MSTFYITTAIDYVNARPHLGTAYEKIGADCMARFQRLCDVDTYFLMGTDEHSTNVEKSAKELGKDTQTYTDEMAVEFEATWKKLLISHDQFIRTSDPRHKHGVQALFQRIYDNGFIYEGTYGGYYCYSCEAFYQEKDLEDGKCPNHKTEPEWVEEKNYFFALSKFSDRLKSHIDANPDFIRPDIRRNEILNVIESGLEDVSVSRHGKTWGVPLPIAEDHVVYVWFDALINYISAIGFAENTSPAEFGKVPAPMDEAHHGDNFNHYWPANAHIVGKDITRFHCLIWPAMLMAADLPVAYSVFAHGFVYNRGEKMSKSIGNIVDPNDLAKFFGADAIRYLLLREIAFNRDGDFTAEQFVTRYNAELANELGNLFSRTLSMTTRYTEGTVPEWTDEAAEETARLVDDVIADYEQAMDRFSFDGGIAAWWRAVTAANRYVEERKPWAQAKAGDTQALHVTLRVLLEVLRMSSVLAIPFMPQKAAEMRRQLGRVDDVDALRLSDAANFGDPNWKTIGESAVLFPKLELPEEG